MRRRRVGQRWIRLVATSCAALAAHPAAAEAPTVRLGPVAVKPYVLQQLDQGGTFGQDRPGGQAAGLNLRRSRLGAEADVAGGWQFGVIWDFGGSPGGHSRLYEAKAAYTAFAPFAVAAGVFKPAFTLEYAQSSADILFLERASVIDIVGGLVAGSGRVVFGQAGASGDRWFASALLTGGTTGPGAQSDQRAVLARAAGLAIKDGDTALHLGVSGAWLFQPPRGPGGRGGLSLSDQPELRIDDVRAPLSTGTLVASGAKIGGIEVGLGLGRLWMQGEWYGIGVDRQARDGGGLFFSGWYAQAAYTLLGAPRQYKPKTATWGLPKPAESFNPAKGAWGAVEVGARFSAADLNDGNVRGGRQRVWTGGISWYPVEPPRFVLQYQRAHVEGGPSPRQLNAVALRGQLQF